MQWKEEEKTTTVLQTNCSDSDVPEAIQQWFAFRVRPRHEKSVALHLRDKREECFVPLVKQKRVWGKRAVHLELPLISGYVFCHLGRFEMLPVLTTPGVVDVIRAGNSPIPIPDFEISALERAVNANVAIQPCPYVEIGQKVQIQSGPLAGITGIVSDRRKSEHIILSVSLLRRSVLVQIDVAHLSPEHEFVCRV